MSEQIIASGMTADQLVELLKNTKAKNAHKALSYFDGEQECQMEHLLSDPQKGRLKWREKGLIPRYRNITKAVVEKSGMLFNNTAPDLQVESNETVNEQATERLYHELDKIEWIEFFNNFDQLVRLLKTGVLLVQYNSEAKKLVLDILHRGNSEVILNPSTREVETLIYRTWQNEGVAGYRVVDSTQYVDLLEQKDGKIVITNQEPNPYGMVPVVPFYDTTTPRTGFWVEPAMDLISMNEMYNLHLTDSEYAISWAKIPTLFTNCKVQQDSLETFEVAQVGTSILPRQIPSTGQMMGGPGRIVQLDDNNTTSPFADYKSPSIDITPLDSVVEGWVRAFASDWSVRINAGGTGGATSGFQLVVEELPNLELRKQRQRMFENGFRRFYRVLANVINLSEPNTFQEDAEVCVEFTDPQLPIESKDQEEIWALRIAEGRATEIDYFIDVLGLNAQEAKDKYREVVEFNLSKPLIESELQQELGIINNPIVEEIVVPNPVPNSEEVAPVITSTTMQE